MKCQPYAITFILATAFLASCHHDADLTIAPPKPPPPGFEFKCSHDTIYFHNFVLPVIISGCAKSGCHDEATKKAGLFLGNYESIISQVTPFDPQESDLYKVLFSNSERRMPPGTPLNMNQKSIIYWWIAQGAYNNRCDSIVCDSSNVTYASSIAPISQAWCTGCHGGSKPANNLLLETYDEMVACANSGRLMGALRHESGFFPMPQGGLTLSPCEINLFQIWINTGKP
ncbi:MAG: hypothetical protein IH596_10300 [Bacteroidales bacterium]|nr:hypothetical protein [Bacteroidales bacterium]